MNDAKPKAAEPAASAQAPARVGPVDTLEAPAASKPASKVTSPREVVEGFFKAFDARDTSALPGFYAPNASFHDNFFDFSARDGILGMWGKLPGDFHATHRIESVDGDVVHAHWSADYTLFGQKIHNEIDSTLTVRDGKIVKQDEHWDYGKWSRQAFPYLPGFLLDAAQPLLRMVVRKTV